MGRLIRIKDSREVATGDIVFVKGKRYFVEGFGGRVFDGREQTWVYAQSMCERKYHVRFTPSEIGCVIDE